MIIAAPVWGEQSSDQFDTNHLGIVALAGAQLQDAGVATVAALGGVFRIAEMFLHLDLQPGLEDLLRQVAQQSSGADKVPAVRSRLVDELLSKRWPSEMTDQPEASDNAGSETVR